jgi:hypothetical protein
MKCLPKRSALEAAVVASALATGCSSGALPRGVAEYTSQYEGGTFGWDGGGVSAPPAQGNGSSALDAEAVEDAAAEDAAEEGQARFVDFDASIFLCDPTARRADGQLVSGVALQGTAQSLSVTPNELSMAWVELDEAGAFSYRVAGRVAADASFGNAQTLALDGLAAPPTVSLSADGLTLVVVTADQHGFVEATRDSAEGAFGALAESRFKSINAWVSLLHGTVGDPAFGADGNSFFYSQSGASATVYESRRTAGDAGPDVWPVGTPLSGPAVSVVSMASEAGTTNLYRHPTALSSDGLTLFILDDYPSATGRSLYRTALGAPFGASKALGIWLSVHPNAACSELYYIEDGAVKFSQKI